MVEVNVLLVQRSTNGIRAGFMAGCISLERESKGGICVGLLKAIHVLEIRQQEIRNYISEWKNIGEGCLHCQLVFIYSFKLK